MREAQAPEAAVGPRGGCAERLLYTASGLASPRPPSRDRTSTRLNSSHVARSTLLSPYTTLFRSQRPLHKADAPVGGNQILHGLPKGLVLGLGKLLQCGKRKLQKRQSALGVGVLSGFYTRFQVWPVLGGRHVGQVLPLAAEY